MVDENNKNIGQISGTSDLILADEQLKLIKDILPKAKKVGILYSTSEVNSQSGIEAYEKAAKKHGVEIITQGISSSADIPMATDSLIKKVDCITNLTDNTVVSNLPTILEKAKNAGIPVFGSEVEPVSYTHLDVYKRQAVYVPADDLTDPAPATTFAHLDATTVLSRAISEKGIYPAVDPLESTSRILDPKVVGEEPVSYTHLDVYKRQELLPYYY